MHIKAGEGEKGRKRGAGEGEREKMNNRGRTVEYTNYAAAGDFNCCVTYLYFKCACFACTDVCALPGAHSG